MRFKLYALTTSLICSLLGSASASSEEMPDALHVLKSQGHPLESAADLDPLLDRIGDARLVLLGEASHGTSEFYTWRAKISQRLIEEKGFNFVVVEGDWAQLWRLNAYVKHLDAPHNSAEEIMQTFNRWPIWMWANEETRDLIEWMRAFNVDREPADRVGFYGMDVYGEDNSLQELKTALETMDVEWAEEALEAYRCLSRYESMQAYVQAVALGAAPCAALVEQALEHWRAHLAEADDDTRYEAFRLKMNAKVVQNAERHYRLMAAHGPDSWNARVDHFYRATRELLDWYGDGARGVAWAHNTHIGDARATRMAAGGQRNIGQITRQNMPGEEVVAVGFGTHRGTVQAGRQWGAEMQTMTVPPGIPGSAEDLMHQAGFDTVLFIWSPSVRWASWLTTLGHRAMGVVYNPEVEHQGNYVPSILPRRYDAFIFIDETTALRPIKH